MVTAQEQFVVNAEGEKTGVLLSLKQYQRLMEDLHDLAIVAERRHEKPIAFEKLKQDLRKNGRL
jgi:PHD/YefM family antitoxin component YafN of YafNO toxin-antitoxin module